MQEPQPPPPHPPPPPPPPPPPLLQRPLPPDEHHALCPNCTVNGKRQRAHGELAPFGHWAVRVRVVERFEDGPEPGALALLRDGTSVDGETEDGRLTTVH